MRRLALPLFVLFAMSTAQSREAMLFCGLALLLWGTGVLVAHQREMEELRRQLRERDQLIDEIEEIAAISLSSKGQLATAQD